MQNLVFDVVGFIWPPKSPDEPTMHVVAFLNAQAKNISTKHLKARTIHNACCMRVQKLENPRMRPGNKQKALTTLWDKCIVFVIEEISMVSAPMYNMLDFRSMYGRSKTHEVHEHNYAQRGNAFGRIPIVIHLGDFLQLNRQRTFRCLMISIPKMTTASIFIRTFRWKCSMHADCSQRFRS